MLAVLGRRYRAIGRGIRIEGRIVGKVRGFLIIGEGDSGTVRVMSVGNTCSLYATYSARGSLDLIAGSVSKHDPAIRVQRGGEIDRHRRLHKRRILGSPSEGDGRAVGGA